VSDFPPLPIVDENNNIIGHAPLQEILAKGLAHRVTHIIVEDERGRILLQKRGPNVSTNQNKWDFSAAGYVEKDETYRSTAIKELREELGLKDVEIEEIGIKRGDETYEGRPTHRFVATYRTVIPAETPLKIEPGEVAEVKWVNRSQIKRFLRDNQSEITPYFANWLQEYYLA
jgi:isopentenyldiphosphate isomerase